MTEVKKKSKLRRWSEDELYFLRENYGKMDIKELAKILDRSVRATGNKAYEVKISNTSRAWSVEEEAELRDIFPTWEADDLEKHFNRTFKGIAGKARKLKIKRRTNVYTYQQVQDIFKNVGCELLSEDYINSKTNLKFTCRCGRGGLKVLTEFLISSQCKQCGVESGAEKRRFSYEQVTELFLERGCRLLSLTYKDSGSKLDYMCSCGAEVSDSLNSFLSKEGCSECWKTRRIKYTKEHVESLVEAEGCKYLSQDIESINAKVTFVCTCKRMGCVLVKSFMEGSRCLECGKESYRRNNSGSNHLNWNPDITDEERARGRNYIEYVNWRTAVYVRDNYTCQCCGKSPSGKINAHHKDGYHWCEERRHDISNGVILCEDCHILGEYSFHSIYGNRNNTETQFNEWMKVYQTLILNERRIS